MDFNILTKWGEMFQHWQFNVHTLCAKQIALLAVQSNCISDTPPPEAPPYRVPIDLFLYSH